jgi:hypothetical protein
MTWKPPASYCPSEPGAAGNRSSKESTGWSEVAVVSWLPESRPHKDGVLVRFCVDGSPDPSCQGESPDNLVGFTQDYAIYKF